MLVSSWREPHTREGECRNWELPRFEARALPAELFPQVRASDARLSQAANCLRDLNPEGLPRETVPLLSDVHLRAFLQRVAWLRTLRSREDSLERLGQPSASVLT